MSQVTATELGYSTNSQAGLEHINGRSLSAPQIQVNDLEKAVRANLPAS